MVPVPFTAAGTAADMLTLSKAAWKLGGFLAKLDQDAGVIEPTVKALAAEAKSLSTECDLVHSELEEVASKFETGITPPYNVNARIWNCLAAQVEETRRSIQELEQLVQDLRADNSIPVGQAQRQLNVDEDKVRIAEIRTQVCRHTANFQTVLLLIKT
jgi:hypothetical protein